MANARNPKRKGHDTSRDQGGFVALPWSVLDCPAYARLSHPARSLLWEFARQYVKDNNGRLLASSAYLAKRGWHSRDVICRAKQELLAAGFIHETVMGHKPNKASWYAVTWYTLDKLNGYDVGASETFERGAYRKNQPLKNATLRPPHGLDRALIVPPHGLETPAPSPSHGHIGATLTPAPSPPHGNHLEMPSDAVCIGDVLSAVPPAVCAGDQPGNSGTQHASTSGACSTLPCAVAALVVPPLARELVTATDDDGEDF